MSIGLVALLVALAAAVLSDMRSRKIPNRLVIAGGFAALVSNTAFPLGEGVLAATGGANGILFALSGIAIGFSALLPLYALRAMGAGDVKLMMMVGAFLGPLQTLGVVVLTFLAGGVLALGMALWNRSFPLLFSNLRFMLTHSMVGAATRQGVKFEPLQHTAGRMPYAVAIAAGTVLQLVLVRSGGWALG